VLKRMMEVVSEPRFKFYVKEGRLYTMKTGVPGVWEEVARRIREQTVEEEKRREAERAASERGVVVRRPVIGARKLLRPVVKVDERIKRQTTRNSRK
jgi:hypothetical protein